MKAPSFSSILNIDLKNKPQENEKNSNEKTNYGPKLTYFTWKAPDREDYSVNNKKFSRSLIIIAAFFGTLFIVMGEYFLILLIASIFFVFYAIKKSPMQIVEHEINTHGISYAGQQYNWDKLENFFFKGDFLLCIDTYMPLPRRLFLLCKKDDRNNIKSYLEKHIPFVQEPPKTSLDKMYEYINNSLNTQG